MPIEYSYEGDAILSYQVVNAIDVTEYNALSDAKKERIKIYLSCGAVNLREGTPSREFWMESAFPEGTTTHTNLLELIRDSTITP